MMRSFKTNICYFLCALLCSAPSRVTAAIEWDAKQVELVAKPNDKTLTAFFGFINSGPNPITITDVQPSCQCTTVELNKRSYRSGEKGEIKAVFTVGERVGLQEKNIRVTTNDANSSVTVLWLRMKIPEPLAYSSRQLSWKLGDPHVEKLITITNIGLNKILSISSIAPSIPNEFVTRIEPIKMGERYQLFIKPVASITHSMNFQMAYIVTFDDDQRREFRIGVTME